MSLNNQNSTNNNHTSNLSNDIFNSLMDLLLTRLADHKNTTLDKFVISVENLKKEHSSKIDTLNTHQQQLFTQYKASCYKKIKCRNANLKRKCAKVRNEGGIDELKVCQQQIDDLKNSSTKEQEDDITELENQIKIYETKDGELEKELKKELKKEFSRQTSLLNSTLIEYASSQLSSTITEITEKIKNPEDLLKEVQTRFEEAQLDCLHHVRSIEFEEYKKCIDCYRENLDISTKEKMTLLRRGRNLIRDLREEIDEFKKDVDLEKIKLINKQKVRALNKKNESSIDHDEPVVIKPVDVMMKDNSRKFERTHCLRQRNVNNLSNIICQTIMK
mmetsp:Transcript_50654/g.64890  ORF Transcript_50654/g.64890 Transcript_50654/m.64890 type:complete len:332 (+) Transcript_50654:29-1024(+)